MQIINLSAIQIDFSSLDFGQILEVLQSNGEASFAAPLFAHWVEILEREEGDIIPFVEAYRELSVDGGEFNLVDLYKHVKESNLAFKHFLSMIALYIELSDDLEESTNLIYQDDFTDFIKSEVIENDLVDQSLVQFMNWQELAEQAEQDYKTFELRPIDYDVYATEPSNIEHYYKTGSYLYRA